MSFASKHNKGAIDWGVDSNDFPFVKREDAFKENQEAVHKVFGLYINTKGNFKDHPVAICDGYKLDLPDYMTEEVRDILKTPEDIEDIKAGKVGFTLQAFVDKKYKKLCYGVNWVDIGE